MRYHHCFHPDLSMSILPPSRVNVVLNTCQKTSLCLSQLKDIYSSVLRKNVTNAEFYKVTFALVNLSGSSGVKRRYMGTMVPPRIDEEISRCLTLVSDLRAQKNCLYFSALHLKRLQTCLSVAHARLSRERIERWSPLLSDPSLG